MWVAHKMTGCTAQEISINPQVVDSTKHSSAPDGYKIGAIPLIAGFLKQFEFGDLISSTIANTLKQHGENNASLLSCLMCDLFIKIDQPVIHYTGYDKQRAFNAIIDESLNEDSCSYSAMAQALEELGHCNLEELFEILANRVLDDIGNASNYLFPLTSAKSIFNITCIGNEPVKTIKDYNPNIELNPIEFIVFEAISGIPVSYKIAQPDSGTGNWEVQQYLTSYLGRAKIYSDRPIYLYSTIMDYDPKICLKRRSAGIHLITRAPSSNRLVCNLDFDLEKSTKITDDSYISKNEDAMGVWMDNIAPLTYIDKDMRKVLIPQKGFQIYNLSIDQKKQVSLENKAQKELLATIEKLNQPSYTELDALTHLKKLVKKFKLIELTEADVNADKHSAVPEQSDKSHAVTEPQAKVKVNILDKLESDIKEAIKHASPSDRQYFKPPLSDLVLLVNGVGYFPNVSLQLNDDAIAKQAKLESRSAIITTDTNRNWNMSELYSVYECCSHIRDYMTTYKNTTVFVKGDFIASPERIRAINFLLNICMLCYMYFNYKIGIANQKEKVFELPPRARIRRLSEKQGRLVCGNLIDFLEDQKDFALKDLPNGKKQLKPCDERIATYLNALGPTWGAYASAAFYK